MKDVCSWSSERKKNKWKFNKSKDLQFPCDSPPVINRVASSVDSDSDNIYPVGSLVRIDVEEVSGEDDIIEGTVRITSESQGYDSGIQNLNLDPIFYEWDTEGLAFSNDYIVEITLTDASAQTAMDNHLVITLKEDIVLASNEYNNVLIVTGIGNADDFTEDILVKSVFMEESVLLQLEPSGRLPHPVIVEIHYGDEIFNVPENNENVFLFHFDEIGFLEDPKKLR